MLQSGEQLPALSGLEQAETQRHKDVQSNNLGFVLLSVKEFPFSLWIDC